MAGFWYTVIISSDEKCNMPLALNSNFDDQVQCTSEYKKRKKEKESYMKKKDGKR